MQAALNYAVLYGALQALVIAVSAAVRLPRQHGRLALLCMMGALGLWQIQTAMGLLQAENDAMAIISILHFPAMFAYPATLSAYLGRLFFARYPASRDLWIALALAALSGLALIVCLYTTPPGLASWREAVVASLSTCGPAMDMRLHWLSLLPRPLTILSGGGVMLVAMLTRFDDLQHRRLRLGSLVLLSAALIGGALSQIAVQRCEIRSNLHAWGAALVTFSVAGVFVLSQLLSRLLDPDQQTARNRLPQWDFDESRLAKILKGLMEQERIYRVEGLSLPAFCAAVSEEGLRINPRQLSEYVNLRLEKNFNAFINEARIGEACKLLREDRNLSVLEIAMQVGFNSKSTFNAAFKDATGLTPSEYRAAPG